MKQISLPRDHFARVAKKEYAEWQTALIREFLQNAVDARATSVAFDYDSANKTLQVIDDGRGMSLDTCENALLTMGGSEKAAGSIGGFGIAKQLLYFAWSEWSIQSRDWKVSGSGCYYSIESGLPHVSGVISRITMDETLAEGSIRHYLRSCRTVATISWNGVVLPTHYPSIGETVEELPWGVLRSLKCPSDTPPEDSYLRVRANGVTMFTTYLGSGLGARVSLDITGNTREILTSNRDGLASGPEADYRKITFRISSERVSALVPKKTIVWREFAGSAGYESTFTEEETREAREAVETARNSFCVFRPVSPVTEQPPIRADNRITILIKEWEGNLSRETSPNTMSYKNKQLLGLWRATLSLVLHHNRLRIQFGSGFTLDPNNLAEYLESGKYPVPYFLVNPLSIPSEYNPDRWTPESRSLLVRYLRQVACHEIAHFIHGEGTHNETFVSTMHRVETNTWTRESEYRALEKARKLTI